MQSKSKKYAVVAVGFAIDKLFHYSIPEDIQHKVALGKRVLVPFRQKKTLGYIVGFSEEAGVSQVKPIESVLDVSPSFDAKMLRLTKWLSEYYFCPWGEVLKVALPSAVRRVRVRPPRPILESEEKFEATFPLKLNLEQKKVLKLLNESIEENKSSVFLLHGITGSGKTEIYLQAIAYVLERGKQAIVLVPEISLTPQTKERFSARFGEKVAILHSQLTGSQRYQTWERVRSGEASIVIGPRSAIFAPVRNLGLVIVDEEHENSYKQMESPRYHTREVAIMRAKLYKAPILLAGATPSLESYYNAEGGCYRLVKLRKRIDNRPLPEVEIVDMREEKSNILSHYLRQELEKTLERREQVILFLNRRGFSNFSLCRRCGHVLRCKNCSVSLTYHASSEKLICHYCNREEIPPKICPRCHSGYIRRLGIGTQQVERKIERLFPSARIQRMDSDTTTKRDSHMRMFTAFRKKEIDILLGTQMIAKGLDFPEVTLVGVISADTSLNFPDFRSSERTFQLLTQVAGRAGRGSMPGRVIIQTYNPEHYAIIASKSHDYEGFYKQELEFRRELLYPPFTHFATLTVSGLKQERVESSALVLKDIITRLVAKGKAVPIGRQVDILGPAPAPLSRVKRKYRWQLTLKAGRVGHIHKILTSLREEIEGNQKLKGVNIIIDVDPVGML